MLATVDSSRKRFRTVRVSNPLTDGYTVKLHPRQDFSIHIPYDESLKAIPNEDLSRILLINSRFLRLCYSTQYQTKNGDTEIIFNIEQIYDLSTWVECTDVSLGEVLVKCGKNYIHLCIYAISSKRCIDNVRNNTITVFDPTNWSIKVRPNDIIHVVVPDKLQDNSTFSCDFDKANAFDVNLMFQETVELDSEPCYLSLKKFYDLSRLPVLVRDHNVVKVEPHKAERHFTFLLTNKHSDCVASDVYCGGMLKFSCDSNKKTANGKPMSHNVGFLKLLVSINDDDDAYTDKDHKICLPEPHMEFIRARRWDEVNRVLINPVKNESITLYAPNFSFNLEIAEPKVFYPSITDGSLWNIKLSQSYIGGNLVIQEDMQRDNCFIAAGRSFVIQKFNIQTCITYPITVYKKYGYILLECKSDNISYTREIAINIAPVQSVGYLKKSKHSDRYYPAGAVGYSNGHHGYHYNNPTFYVSDIHIDKIDGGLSNGLQMKTIYNTPPVNVSPHRTANVGLPIASTLPSFADNNDIGKLSSTNDGKVIEISVDSAINHITLCKNDKLILTIVDSYNNLIDQNNMWVCNVMQKNLRVVHVGTTMSRIASDMIYKFEFVLCPYYLPATNKHNYFLAGIKFSTASKTKNKSIRYASVYLSNNSRYDRLTEFSTSYLATGLLERLDDKKYPGFPTFHRTAESTISLHQWSHNIGLVVNPKAAINVFLPSHPSKETKVGFIPEHKWNVKLKQYPVPMDVWDILKDFAGINKDEPWWPDELHPDSASDYFKLSEIHTWQNNFHDIMDVYKEHFKCLSVPLGELIFRTNVIEQNREINGTLIRTRQRYVKKIYLYGLCDHIIEKAVLCNNEDNYIDVTSRLSGQSLVVPRNSILRVILHDYDMNMFMIPYWLRLREMYLYDNKKFFIFELSETNIQNMDKDESAYAENWLVFAGNNDQTIRFKLSLDN